MSTHFTQDEFVLAYYDESEIDARRQHLDTCDECRTELARLTGVLDQVTPAEIAEPDDDYEARAWDRLSWRLRGERKQASRGWTKWLAAAAMLAVAFLGGLLWNRSNTGPVHTAATNQPTSNPNIEPTTASTQQQRDRILLVVVGDHLDDSERMLVELTNLTATNDIDVSTEQQRAEELLVSNRLYRSTALHRGEDRVATLLDELEPMLMQIAHGPSQLTPDELRKIQKRVEAKGLVFKLRVLRADVRATSVPHLQQQPNI
jgi:predicted anti-sigma-YlaC factor YlaD